MLATTLIVHLALILHFFVLFGRILKSVFLFGPLQVVLAIMSNLGTVIPALATKFAFFLFHLSFFEPVMLLFSSALQHLLSKSLTPCSSHNFPLHLHTCFLMYTDDKILPNKYVLKWFLILVTHSSNFFCSLYIMADNWIGNLWQPMPFVGEKNAYAWDILYYSSPLFAPNGGYHV